jgi:hypothetical protein
MPDSQADKWQPIVGLVLELKRCDECDITTAAVAMVYICIDTLANLARPVEKAKATRADFKEWVDTYLKAHDEQPYQYRGKDVYAGRCALLHKYGAETELNAQDPDTKKFAYHDGGKHQYDPSVDSSLVLIGKSSFINDVIIGIESFLKACQSNQELRTLVESRLEKVFQQMPLDSRYEEHEENT